MELRQRVVVEAPGGPRPLVLRPGRHAVHQHAPEFDLPQRVFRVRVLRPERGKRAYEVGHDRPLVGLDFLAQDVFD